MKAILLVTPVEETRTAAFTAQQGQTRSVSERRLATNAGLLPKPALSDCMNWVTESERPCYVRDHTYPTGKLPYAQEKIALWLKLPVYFYQLERSSAGKTRLQRFHASISVGNLPLNDFDGPVRPAARAV